MNSSLKAEIDRAFVGEKAVHTTRCFPVGLVCFQGQPHMDAPDDEDIVFQLDFTYSLGYQSPIRCINLTRLQRASVGSGKSTGGCGDNIIQSRSVRFHYRRRNLVMFRDRAMHTENHGLGFSGKPGSANRSFHAFDSNLGTIDDW